MLGQTEINFCAGALSTTTDIQFNKIVKNVPKPTWYFFDYQKNVLW